MKRLGERQGASPAGKMRATTRRADALPLAFGSHHWKRLDGDVGSH